MILVDTSVWVDYFNGKQTPQTNILDRLLDNQILSVGDLIYTEILQGFRSDKDFETARTLLDALVFYNMLNQSIALKSAQYYRQLRKKGVTIRKTIDMLIATFCMEHKLTLLQSDADFENIAKHLPLLLL